MIMIPLSMISINTINLRKKKSRKMIGRLILLPIMTIAFLIVSVVVFGLGLDKNLTSNHLEGQITDNEMNPIYDASVCIKETCSQTNEDGFYRLENITSGTIILSVSSPTYQDFSEPIYIKRGKNLISFSLENAELNDAEILLVEEGKEIVTQGLELTIDSIPYALSEGNKLLLPQFKTGEYELVIKSEYYVDVRENIYIEGNKTNTYTVGLEPASKLTLKLQNWLDLAPVSNAKINIDNNQIVSNSDGLLVLKEIPSSTTTITINHEDFLPKEIIFEQLLPGDNPDKVALMVGKGNIVYTKATPNGSQIFISNIDGSDPKQLTAEGENHNPWLDIQNKKVFFSTKVTDERESVQWVSIDGEETTQLSDDTLSATYRGNKYFYYEKDFRVYAEETSDKHVNIYSTRLDDSNLTNYPDLIDLSPGKYFINDDASAVIHTTGELKEGKITIYSTSLRYKRTSRLAEFPLETNETELRIHSLSGDSNQLTMTIGTNLFLLATTNNSLVRLTEDGYSKLNITFQPEGKNISYIKDINGEKKLFVMDTLSKKEIQVSPENSLIEDYRWLTDDTILYNSNGQLWMLSLLNHDSPYLIAEDASIN